jgi:hypothetical protein
MQRKDVEQKGRKIDNKQKSKNGKKQQSVQKRKKKTSCVSQMERPLFLPTNAEMDVILFSGAEFENGRNL